MLHKLRELSVWLRNASAMMWIGSPLQIIASHRMRDSCKISIYFRLLQSGHMQGSGPDLLAALTPPMEGKHCTTPNASYA